MSSFQYVMANIQMPIKVYNNNITEPLPEYIKINITECKELPETKDTPAIQSDFLDQIQQLISPKKEELKLLTISKDELKNKKIRKRNLNQTFKTNLFSKNRTHRNYSNF